MIHHGSESEFNEDFSDREITSLIECEICGAGNYCESTAHVAEVPDLTNDAVEVVEDTRGTIPQEIFDLNNATTKKILIGVNTLAGFEESQDDVPTVVEKVQTINREAA